MKKNKLPPAALPLIRTLYLQRKGPEEIAARLRRRFALAKLTRQAIAYHLRRMDLPLGLVPVGRPKHPVPPRLHHRCAVCREPLPEGKRRNARTCGRRCIERRYRQKLKRQAEASR